MLVNLAAATLVAVWSIFGVEGWQAQRGEPSLEQREQKLQELVGKQLYACSGAKFFEFEVVAQGGTPPGMKIFWKIFAAPFPLLTPLEVRKVIAHGGITESRNVYVVVQLGQDKQGVVFGHMRTTGPLLSGDDLVREVVGPELEGELFTKIPEHFTKDEVESIRLHAASRGMSLSAVYCALGWPEATNDYGTGGKQLIYAGGRLIVYVAADSDKVVEIQEFH
jgi:hypothetical protein